MAHPGQSAQPGPAPTMPSGETRTMARKTRPISVLKRSRSWVLAAKVSKATKMSGPMTVPIGSPGPPITLVIRMFAVAPSPIEPGEMRIVQMVASTPPAAAMKPARPKARMRCSATE